MAGYGREYCLLSLGVFLGKGSCCYICVGAGMDSAGTGDMAIFAGDGTPGRARKVTLTGRPKAVSWRENHTSVFCKGEDGQAWHREYKDD